MIKKSKKQMKILIPNATSPKNIGDRAMLEVLTNLLTTVYKNPKVTVHSFDPGIYRKENFNPKQTLYSWAMFKNKRINSRIGNMFKLAVQYLIIKLKIKNFQIDKDLNLLLEDYKKANLIIFAPGGYLRSKRGIKQSLNLIMQLLPFVFASLLPAKKIVAPISVGPFAYKWQEKMVAKVLKQMDLIALREEFSYNMLSRNKVKNIVLSCDYALMIKRRNNKIKRQNLTLGFTVREWLDGDKSANFERFFINAITKFSKLTGVKIQPIIQVNASMYGEDDVSITRKIAKKIKEKNIHVTDLKKIATVQEALKTYSNIDILWV